MKKLVAWTMAVLMTVTSVVTFGPAPVSAASPYFSHNPALNGIFQQMEKQFMQYPNDELVPLKYYIPIGNSEDKKDTVKRTVKKITDAQRKAAAERQLNEIRAMIEIEEEDLGGLTAQDYKVLTNHLTQQMLLAKNSDFGWNTEGTKVSLYLSVNDERFYHFEGLVGNFAGMGKEKDVVVPSDLLVKNKINRYLNQAVLKGNKIGADVLKQLPAEVEKIFMERQPSRIAASRALARIHDRTFNPDYYKFDGSESVEELAEAIDGWVDTEVEQRDEEKALEFFQFPADEPSDRFKEYIAERILDEELTESFTSGFKKAITLDELAKLHFESREFSDNIIIEDPAIAADSPDYIKQAYIYGMLDDEKALTKPLTRLEAARHMVDGTVYDTGFNNWLEIADAGKIPIADQRNVSICIRGGMVVPSDKFEPQASYTKEQAIRDDELFPFDSIRGYNIPTRRTSQIILGKNTIHLIFEDKATLAEYMDDYWDDTPLDQLKPNGKYTKVDTGGAVIEINTPENGIKFTMKTGVGFFDLEEGVYGPGLNYNIEPKVVKATDKLDMAMQVDSINKKLNPKLDAILAKIIKPKMTDQQKVKAIHDYMVTHVTYDITYRDANTVESVLVSIEKGRGVCGDYALLFMYLCRRANIPVVSEVNVMMEHAWNSVYINGQWLFVDVTWDDDGSGKIKYDYFLKDRFTFMKTHFPIMGVPDIKLFRNLDPMKLKSQDEIRAYLLDNFYWTDGYKVSFGVTDKNLKPIITYMKDSYVTVSLTYNAKTNLYTVTAKRR